MTVLTRAETIEHFLRPLTSSAGTISALALDHRDALRNVYKRVGVPNVSDETMLDLKRKIVDALAVRASAILIDSAAVTLAQPHRLGVLMPLEAQGHDGLAGGRLNRLLEDFGPADAGAMGADGCKLLLYYRADHPQTANRQLELTARAAADCHRHGLPLVVEPKVYLLNDEDDGAYAERFGELIVAGARDLADSGADLLKLQFPGDANVCERVSAAASPLHWTLLGGGDIDGETFASQLLISCRAGACGFIAGRAIWGAVLGLAANAQDAWLQTHGRPLFERLVDIADTYARRIR
jgi:tagatose 1,6-diphosphate aldolase